MAHNLSMTRKLFRKLTYPIYRFRAKTFMVDKILPFLDKKDKIIDIGSGSCSICEILSENGFDITPLDIKNSSVVESIKPIIYGGKKIPFPDKSFDVSLIITVLHHTQNPEKLLKEAKRVSKKIIIIEDIYSNIFQKYFTYFLDSLVNFEFRGHPHSNKTDKGWKAAFKKLKLKITDTRIDYCFPAFKIVMYVLE